MGICEARNKRQNCKRGVQGYKARHGSNNAHRPVTLQHRARLLQGRSRKPSIVCMLARPKYKISSTCGGTCHRHQRRRCRHRGGDASADHCGQGTFVEAYLVVVDLRLQVLVSLAFGLVDRVSSG